MKTFIKKTKLFLIPLFAAAVMFAANGCDKVLAPQADNVDFSVMSTDDTVDNPILVLTAVKLLIKDIKLNVANGIGDSTNFKVGPYILYLDMSSTVNIVSMATIPAGTYDKVRFMVHKLGDNETVTDPEFADANGRYSVVVRGLFAGIPFVYKSTKSAHQKLTFPGQLQVSLSGKSNITLQVKPYLWFRTGGTFIDPSNPNNRSVIDNNIKENINNNFKAFVDNDRNGQPD
jgi:hypothetical protein